MKSQIKIITIITPVLGLILCLFSSCKKYGYHDDYCQGLCYILSGSVYDDSTNLPAENVRVIFKVSNKYVVYTDTDTTGAWKMSFDSDYIDYPAKGKLIFEKNTYFTEEMKIVLSRRDIGEEKSYLNTIHKSGSVYIKLNISKVNAEKVRAKYTFEGNEYTRTVNTHGAKPSSHNYLIHILPAFKDLDLSLSYTITNQGGNEWTRIAGFPIPVNVNYQETDTVEVSF